MPQRVEPAEVTVRCDPCTRRRGYLRTIPAMVVLSRRAIPGEPGRHLWMVRQVDRMARARQAPVLSGSEIDRGSLHAPGGGVELRCRACGYRPRMRLRDLYAAADRALAEGRAEVYV
jgi:ribosomal protein S14